MNAGLAFPLLPPVAPVELGQQCKPAKLGGRKVGRPGAQLGLQTFER